MQWRFWIAVACMAVPLDAATAQTTLLSPHGENASIPPAFVTAMSRTRLVWMVHGTKPLGRPIEPDGPHPSGIPFYWEADDGSTVRRMSDGSFRLEEWSQKSSWAQMIACYPAGWPNYDCSDGVPRSMSAPDLNTMNFGGQTFGRLLPTADPALDDPPFLSSE